MDDAQNAKKLEIERVQHNMQHARYTMKDTPVALDAVLRIYENRLKELTTKKQKQKK